MSLAKPTLLIALLFATQAYAQAPAPSAAAVSTAGAMVIVPAFGEVRHANDQAIVTFSVEEHDKDKAKAAERVNRKMKEGTEILRKADPRAEFKTMGYFTYPIYPENVQPPRPVDAAAKPPVPVAWRVGQYLEMKTTSLESLPRTAASAQKVLAINGVQFGLAPATEKRLDDQRIAATYKNLNERIVSIANAMGRKPADAVLETVDFEGSGNYAGGQGDMAAAPMMARMSAKREMADAMPEPSFEPGETTLQMRLVGKVKFK
ncbi:MULTISPECIES: SIMPL domain-containing protein [unclassified Massilia]|uniref:SIMPL domain-containing protein n=1 Tax=unclassified Massilia TaxID=2609279 RepID=UPI001B81D7B8|nr:MULTISPECIES: SIMPL domain-containing protein [unclassified Massilia]MBQ5942765.1 SIMPL domain-containing protein [Massilia sp. AB1]MBQ5963992.1 SIMPL domain-containing protein [Massilia sp. ZL223]